MMEQDSLGNAELVIPPMNGKDSQKKDMNLSSKQTNNSSKDAKPKNDTKMDSSFYSSVLKETFSQNDEHSSADSSTNVNMNKSFDDVDEPSKLSNFTENTASNLSLNCENDGSNSTILFDANKSSNLEEIGIKNSRKKDLQGNIDNADSASETDDSDNDKNSPKVENSKKISKPNFLDGNSDSESESINETSNNATIDNTKSMQKIKQGKKFSIEDSESESSQDLNSRFDKIKDESIQSKKGVKSTATKNLKKSIENLSEDENSHNKIEGGKSVKTKGEKKNIYTNATESILNGIDPSSDENENHQININSRKSNKPEKNVREEENIDEESLRKSRKKSTQVQKPKSDTDNEQSDSNLTPRIQKCSTDESEDESISKSKNTHKMDDPDESGNNSAIEVSSSSELDELDDESAWANVTVNYSSKEDKYFSQNNKRLQQEIRTKINHCTACYSQVHCFQESFVFTHPVLGVLVCRKCRKFYGKGDFQKDPEGYDNYCRWCANGGDVLLCDFCTNGFCKKCVKRNLGRAAETEAIKAKTWKCYVCSNDRLIELRALQRSILDSVQKNKLDKKSRATKSNTLKEKITSLRSKQIKDKENWMDISIEEMEGLLSESFTQVEKIKQKQNVKSLTVEIVTQNIRRLTKLCSAMGENFFKLKDSIEEKAKKFPPKTICDSKHAKNGPSTSKTTKSASKDSSSDGKETPIKREPGPISSKMIDASKELLKKTDSSNDEKRSEKSKKRQRESFSEDTDHKDPTLKKIKDEPSANDFDGTSNSSSDNDFKNICNNGTTSGENSEEDTIETKIKKEKDTDASIKKGEKAESKLITETKEDMFQDSSDEDTETSQKVTEIIGKVSNPHQNDKVGSDNSSDSTAVDFSDNPLQNDKMTDENKSVFDILNAEDTYMEQAKGKSSDESSTGSRSHKKKSKSSKNPSKEGDKNKNAMKALLNSESENSEIDINELKIKKKLKRKRPAPRSKSQYYSEEEELSKCQIKVERFPSKIDKLLSKHGTISLTKHPALLKFKPFSKKQLATLEDSDEEFSSIMKFKVVTEFDHKVVDTDSSSGSDISSEAGSEKATEKKKKIRNMEEKEKKQKEGLMDINLDEDKNAEEDLEEKEETFNPLAEPTPTEEEKMNNEMKKALLMSSDESEDADVEDEEEDGDKEEEKKKAKEKEKELEEKRRERYEKKKKKLREEKEGEEDKEDSSSEEDVKRRRKNFLVSLKFSSSEDDDDSEDESPRKTRMFVESDSDFESENKKKKGSKKRTLLDSSDYNSSESSMEQSSSEEEEEKPTPKRKRIRRTSTSSEEGAENNTNEDSQTPNKKRRRHIIRDEDLTESTKNAAQQEEERCQRVNQRQKIYNKIFEIDVEKDQKELDKFVLDFDPDSKKELVKVNKKLLEYLKPHQVKGIKFMYDTTVESLDRLESNHKGSGCILAHCMGLGKTLQVITYIHSLLTNDLMDLHVRRVMVCCPVNTVYNWVSEFKSWLKGKLLSFDVVELISAKDLWTRAYRLDDWFKEGGVCIIGYDMFRNLSNEKQKRFKGRMKEIFQKSLVDPGPDVIVCDEGHILKNEKTALSIAINKVKTARRIVLTGTPLQNNLKEYHCMIQFVKPNLLGTKKEFFNRFVNPIEAGQCMDALPRDVKRMKRRAHILHNMLEGCVQRFDYTVLKPFLPPKFEYVVSIQMSKLQCKLYRYYLENLSQGGPKRSGSGLFLDFHNLQQIWNHPRMLLLGLQRNMDKFEEDSMSDFINDSDSSESSEDDKKKNNLKSKSSKESSSEKEERESSPEIVEERADNPAGLTSEGKVKSNWFQFLLRDYFTQDEKKEDDDFEEEEFLSRVELGGKVVLLLNILKDCQNIGDKLLVFSQSLLTLNVIEEFLAMVDSGSIKLPSKKDDIPLHFKNWKPGRDYLRLDGSISADIRKMQCEQFNDKHNERCRLFLISTRAGGIGINLIGANRVVIFDSSWNPSHDTQSMFRVYRFGQAKPVYIYRFVAQGTMEQKIYSRQVTKISTALRVVDEHQIKRYFNMGQLAELYEFDPADPDKRETPNVPEDRLLADMLINLREWIVDFHEHDSLLENQTEEELNEEERKAAWEDYENEKKGLVPQAGRQYLGNFPNDMYLGLGPLPTYDPQALLNQIRAQQQTSDHQTLRQNVFLATQQILRAHIGQYQKLQATVNGLKNPIIAPEILKSTPFASILEALQAYQAHMEAYQNCIRQENSIISQISPYVSNSAKSTLTSPGLLYGNPSSTAAPGTSEYVHRSYKVVNPGSEPSTSASSSSSNFKIKLPFSKPQAKDPLSKENDDTSEVVTLE